MSLPNFFILYVNDALVSTRFYTDLLGKPPLDASPSFAMFALESGVTLAVWSRHTVEPAVTETGSGVEVVFTASDDAKVDELFSEWQRRDVQIPQSPVKSDFGYTFVALDPDKHRLRVYAPIAR